MRGYKDLKSRGKSSLVQPLRNSKGFDVRKLQYTTADPEDAKNDLRIQNKSELSNGSSSLVNEPQLLHSHIEKNGYMHKYESVIQNNLRKRYNNISKVKVNDRKG